LIGLNSLGFKNHVFLVLALGFFAAGYLIKYYYIDSRQSHSDYVLDITSKVRREIKAADQELDLLTEQIRNDGFISFSGLSSESPYFYFVFKNKKLGYWSGYRYNFSYPTLAGDSPLDFLDLKNGKFLVIRRDITIKSDQFEIFYLIPLYVRFNIENDYVKSFFNRTIFPNPDLIIRNNTGDQPEQGAIYDQDDGYLFSVEFGPDYHLVNRAILKVLIPVFSISTLLTLIYLIFWVKYFAINEKFGIGLVLFTAGLLAIRAGMIFFDFPYGFRPYQYQVFDPRFFASSSINPSLGDLLLNTICLLLIIFYFFRYFTATELYKKIYQGGKVSNYLFSVLAILITFFSLFSIPYLFQLIYENSQISLTISAPDGFQSLKLTGFIIFAILSLIFFQISHLSFKVVSRLANYAPKGFFLRFLSGALVFLVLSILLKIPILVALVVNLGYFTVLYFFGLPRFLVAPRYPTFLYFFVCSIACAVVGSYSVYSLEKQREIRNKVRFANQFLIENDHLAEYLLNNSVQKIKRDPFIKNSFLSPFASKEAIEQKNPKGISAQVLR